MIRALIVDDEPWSRRAVRQLCEGDDDVVIVGECDHADSARRQILAEGIDVVFLDVRMPGASGLELAAAIPSTGPLVVLITAHPEFALPAFDASAVDFITKPIDPGRFSRAMDRLRARLRVTPVPQPHRYVAALTTRRRGVDWRIPVTSIEFIAASDVYAEVHGPSGQHLVRQSLDALETSLDPAVFVRVHRSFLVARGHVSGVRRGPQGARTVVMRSGAEIPVSRRRRAALRHLSAR